MLLLLQSYNKPKVVPAGTGFYPARKPSTTRTQVIRLVNHDEERRKREDEELLIL